MVGEDEDGSVVRRVIAPPPLPSVVGPKPANRPEHISTENPSSNIGKAAGRKAVIDARRAAVASMHLLERSGGEEPLEHRHAADTERVIEVLIKAGTVAVQGNAEAENPQFGHECRF